MKISISAATPIYNTSNGELTIKLTLVSGGQADIAMDFEQLLPFANLVSPEVIDFFVLSACAYGIDRFIERRINSVDGWSRELRVSLPVSNIKKWSSAKAEVESLLSFLSGDYWEVNFYKSEFEYPKKSLEDEYNADFFQVNLFSGGLDSLIGAIDFLESHPKKKVLFTSHYDSQMGGPKKDQQDLLLELEKKYAEQFVHVPSVRLSLINSNINSETTFRSRSILFIGIALITAQAKQLPIVVPENGTVSLNYPLSPSRRSACSTRTTHPTFIAMLREVWAKLGIRTTISNPYEYQTKGDMVAQCRNVKFLQSLVAISNSCGKRGHRAHWTHPDASHCGVCMPCVYRQASLQQIKDTTTYGTGINELFPFKTKKGQDVGACLDYLKKTVTRSDMRTELIINGVRDLANVDGYVDVVAKTRKELKSWVKKIGNKEIKLKAGI